MLANVELEKLKWNEEKRVLEHGEDIMKKVKLAMVKASDMNKEVFERVGNKVFSGVLTKDDMGTIITLGNGKVLGTYGDYEIDGKVVAVWAPDDEGDDNYIVIGDLLEQDEVLLRAGRIPRDFGFEHFRLEFKLKGKMTNEVPLITTLLSDGLYIVNPEFNLTQQADVIMTDEETYERFIYTETAVIDTTNRTVTFFNGDGWEYIVGFDDIVGTAAVPMDNVLRQVILVTKYTWNR